jgi:hypothetical protein
VEVGAAVEAAGEEDRQEVEDSAALVGDRLVVAVQAEAGNNTRCKSPCMRDRYDDNIVLKEALQQYFSRYHFVNGGYDWKWFKIKLGPVFIPLPNIPARVRAVKIHDVHHVITGYTATLKGEAEIGAWEIASGCGRYYVAWYLNFCSFAYGLLFFFPAVMRAFIAGRKSCSFYKGTVYESLLDKNVGWLRQQVDAKAGRQTSLSDYLLFAVYSISVVVVIVTVMAAIFMAVKHLISLF